MSQEWIFDLDQAPTVRAYAKEAPGLKTDAILVAERKLTHLLTQACEMALGSLDDSEGTVVAIDVGELISGSIGKNER